MHISHLVKLGERDVSKLDLIENVFVCQTEIPSAVGEIIMHITSHETTA